MISSDTNREELERIYREAPLLPLPSGQFFGRYLVPLDSEGARKLHIRLMNLIGFRLTPFGIDFDSRRWFFFHPRLQAGTFAVTAGASRWRETEAQLLRYDSSRLPIRHVLYDELKPLADGSVLGMGGLNAERGQGDHFFFLLVPR